MRNNSVKLFLVWASGSGGDVLKRVLILVALLFGGAEPFMRF